MPRSECLGTFRSGFGGQRVSQEQFADFTVASVYQTFVQVRTACLVATFHQVHVAAVRQEP